MMPVNTPLIFITISMIKRRRRTITIQDVAREAGVSVSTVSRVLNNKDDVAMDTVEKVQGVIKKLGYASSLAARGMRSHRTNIIGLIMPDVASTYSAEVMRGVNEAIAHMDYDLLVYTSGDMRKYYSMTDQEHHYVMLLNGGITDGAIVVAGAATHISTDTPVVVIDPNNESPDLPAITCTNREGVMAAMKYLTSLGHCRIAHITGRMELVSACQRLQGYKDGLAAAGIAFDDRLVQVSDYNVDLSAECARALLAMPDPPTAIFAANDMSAIGVYQAAKEAGVRIPNDLSVVGFDNVRDSMFLDPPLTTVDQFIADTARLATEMVVSLVEGETLKSNFHKVQTQLLIRGSCAPHH
jgi:LacI family transcriptional regulator